MYEERVYRSRIVSKFKLEVSFKESDLLICSDKKISQDLAESILIKYYNQIKEYLKQNPAFLTSLSPFKEDKNAPEIVRKMIEASSITGIGPFSCVAGVIAQYTGIELLRFCDEIIVENGGDIFCKINEDKALGVYLGENFGVKNLTLKIRKKEYPFGIASSSSTIGHSLNFGKADLVTVIAKDAALADSFATSLSNKVKKKEDVDKILEEVKDISFIQGLFIAFEGNIFIWGDVEILDTRC
ncbi:MAG: UPF0280 family protein [Candidatus Omnitrophota bacterium]